MEKSPKVRRITEQEFVVRYRQAYRTPGALIVVNLGEDRQTEPAWVMLED